MVGTKLPPRNLPSPCTPSPFTTRRWPWQTAPAHCFYLRRPHTRAHTLKHPHTHTRVRTHTHSNTHTHTHKVASDRRHSWQWGKRSKQSRGGQPPLWRPERRIMGTQGRRSHTPPAREVLAKVMGRIRGAGPPGGATSPLVLEEHLKLVLVVCSGGGTSGCSDSPDAFGDGAPGLGAAGALMVVLVLMSVPVGEIFVLAASWRTNTPV